MIENLQAVLFDLDGTLVDTAPDFVRIVNNLRAQHQLAPLPYDEIRAAVSAGARAMIKVGFPHYELESPEFLALRQQLLDDYYSDICQDSRVFEGLDSLLTQFEKKQIPWGIVTNKPRHLSEALLSALNLTERCAVLVCPDDVKNTKPDPEPMYLACKKLAVDCQKTIYIGDHLRDIQAGKNANMTTIAVGFGYIVEGEKIEDWQADYSVETVAELVDLFKLGE